MPANWMYKRGDVYMMDLNPYSGSEQGGIRPAIVVQNDDGNFYSNVLLVVPLTTQIKKRNMPTHFILHNRFLSAPSMAICESPRPADKSRVLSYLGHLSKYEMRQVSVCLQYSFGFIGYKSFRKYLTAPPQEDVLAAAKELLSQQFQNLRVLNSQPPALTKHTKGDLHSIEQISERMLSTPTESSVEFMVAELDDALQSLMFRWNICYERYDPYIEAEDDPTLEVDGREMFEHFRFVADAGQTLLRVDKFLTERMQRTSRNRIQQAADAGCILVGGKLVKSSYRVKPFDTVSIVMDRPRYDNEILPEDIPLDIVYEDEAVLVVNKPAGLVVHPGHGNWTGTLVNALAWHFRDTPEYDVDDPRLGLVHRIDKDTSGLLVIAKTPEAKTLLGKQFFEKTTRREYVALVWGDFDTDSGTIEGNIARNPRNRLQMCVTDDPEVGKHAVTHWQVLERFGYVTLVKCVLETGAGSAPDGRLPDTAGCNS